MENLLTKNINSVVLAAEIVIGLAILNYVPCKVP